MKTVRGQEIEVLKRDPLIGLVGTRVCEWNSMGVEVIHGSEDYDIVTDIDVNKPLYCGNAVVTSATISCGNILGIVNGEICQWNKFGRQGKFLRNGRELQDLSNKQQLGSGTYRGICVTYYDGRLYSIQDGEICCWDLYGENGINLSTRLRLENLV